MQFVVYSCAVRFQLTESVARSLCDRRWFMFNMGYEQICLVASWALRCRIWPKVVHSCLGWIREGVASFNNSSSVYYPRKISREFCVPNLAFFCILAWLLASKNSIVAVDIKFNIHIHIHAAMICRSLPTCSAPRMMSYSVAPHPIPITFCIRTCQARLTFPTNFVPVLTAWH